MGERTNNMTNNVKTPLESALEIAVLRERERQEDEYDRVVRIERTAKVLKRYFTPEITWRLIEEFRKEGVF